MTRNSRKTSDEERESFPADNSADRLSKNDIIRNAKIPYSGEQADDAILYWRRALSVALLLLTMIPGVVMFFAINSLASSMMDSPEYQNDPRNPKGNFTSEEPSILNL